MTINNNIKEDYCSFEVSKLLKEKGFEIPIREYYRNYPTASIMMWDIGKFMNGNDDTKMETAGGMTYISAPTHALAIKWIRENFGIHIDVWTYYNPVKINQVLFEWGASHIDNQFDANLESASNRFQNEDWILDINKYQIYEGYYEATEAALLYTLTNLIK